MDSASARPPPGVYIQEARGSALVAYRGFLTHGVTVSQASSATEYIGISVLSIAVADRNVRATPALASGAAAAAAGA